MHVLKYYKNIVNNRDWEIRFAACYNLPAVFSIYPFEEATEESTAEEMKEDYAAPEEEDEIDD